MKNTTRYYFLNPKTGESHTIHNGRSVWEDRIDKDDFIVVQEVGPAMNHWQAAMNIRTPERPDGIAPIVEEVKDFSEDRG